MHVVAVTSSHRGDDARIVHRQARALLEHGHRVTLVAPDPGNEARRFDPDGLVRVPIPRVAGRRRVGAWLAVRRAVKSLRRDADLIVIHDPELVPIVTAARRGGAVFAWDVHEDFVAMALDTVWVPRPLRRLLGAIVRLVEWYARRRCRIVLAEDSYARRFPGAPVVPNTTWIPDAPAALDDDARVVYVGRVSFDRGVRELIEVGARLRASGGPRVVVVGAADAECESLIAEAHRHGDVDWCGPLPNPEALAVIRGALAGLSLLHDIPNYRVSRPTKVIEYLACGVPVVSTPLPLAAALIDAARSGIVTQAWSGSELVDEVVAAVAAYADDSKARDEQGVAGWTHVRDHSNWGVDGPKFVHILEEFVTDAR